MHLNCTKLYTVILCCITAPLSMFAKDNKLNKEQVQQMGIKKPLVFVENKGQITNQYNQPRKDIQYELYGKGVNIFVGKGQVHYQFNKLNFTDNKSAKPFEQKQTISSVRCYRMDVSLVGANKNAKVITEDKQEYHESYQLEKIGRKKVTAYTYGKIIYKDVYPNIDWVLYTKNNKLEYDFVVRPGGNAKNIKLKYEGATKLALENGELVMESPLAKITEEKPYTYDAKTGAPIASSFILKNKTLSFNTAPHSGTIIIDPLISFLTYYGGNSSDQSTNAVMDASGNVYSVGWTNSVSSIATVGARDTVYNHGAADCFIAKYNSSGTLIWGSYIGASGDDYAQDVAYDGTYLYITGYTSSVTSSGFATKNAYDTTYHGGSTGMGATGDAFLLKYTTSDSLLWCTYYGGTGSDGGYGVACDQSGNIYMTGITNSRGPMASTDGYDTAYNGGGDIFLAKFNSSGSRVWGTYFGGSGADAAYGVAVDKAGNPYLAGNTTSTGIATSGAFQTSFTTSFGQAVGVIVKFKGSNGQLIWSTYYGNGGTQAYTVAFDTANKLYVAGYTNSSSGIASANAWQGSFGGGFGFVYDIFLAKFDTSGANRLWGTYYGGTGSDINVSGMAFDAWNNVIFTGHSSSTNSIAIVGIDSFDVPQRNLSAGRDITITKFTPLGQLLWGTFYGGQRDDEGRGLVYNASNDGIYVSGYTNSADSFINGNTGYDTVFGTFGATPATYDAFLMKLNPDTFVVINQPYIDTLLCAGSTFTLNYTASHAFNSGNTFTAQLSSATGSFAAPTTIGTATASTSGGISCTIPGATPNGNGYKIRILASNPIFYSPTDFYNIHIVASVAMNPSITSNSPTCVGDSIKLTANTTAPPNNTFTWAGPVGFTATTQSLIRTPVTATMAGTYKVYISHSGCPQDSASTTVVVNNTFANAPVDSTNAPVCSGTDLKLYSRTTTAGVTYSWTGPSGFSSGIQNPVIPAAPSTATGVYYTIINLNGCKSKDSIYAEVDVPSTPNISVSVLSDTICAGDDASFSSSILFGGSTPGYQWVVNSELEIGAISSVWGSPYLNTGDTIYCILTSSAFCVSPVVDTSNKIVIHIDPIVPPTVVVTASPGNIFTPGLSITFTANVINGGTSPTYQWRVNGVNVTGATNNTYTTNTLNFNDKITVLVHSNAMCTSPDSALGNIISVSAGSISSTNNIGIYPNPNTGNFIISGTFNNTTDNEATIEILNVTGQVVYTDKASVHNGMIQKRIDLGTNVPGGMYMLRLRTENDHQTQQFIIRR